MTKFVRFSRMGFSMAHIQILQTIRTRSVRCIACMNKTVNLKTVKHRLTPNFEVGVTSLLRTAFYKKISACNYGSHYDRWTELSYEDLVALMESGGVQLIDVREKREIEEQGSFPGSVNIPLADLKDALNLEDRQFLDKYQISKPEKHDTNLVFVGFGPVKSTTALEIAHKLGYKKARHYVGGFEEWKERRTAH